jgi:hypothetical protein
LLRSVSTSCATVRCPSEFSKSLLETPALPQASRPPGGLAARSESIESAMYRVRWVPRSRFAVSPRPGCAVFHRQVGPITVKQAAADSRRTSASLWSFAQPLPARPPQQTGDSHGLLFPSAHARFGDRFVVPGDSHSPSASAFRVFYPLDGFVPPKPGRLCFAPAALMGFALRSFPLPRRCPVCFHPSGPTCRLFVWFTTPHMAARPARTTAASGL